ncbi:MAG: hypothetical protein U1F20_01295 [Lysobacterales bacterium]
MRRSTISPTWTSRRKPRDRDPRDNAQRERLLISRATLGAYGRLAELDEASALLRQAIDAAKELQAIEPASTSFGKCRPVFGPALPGSCACVATPRRSRPGRAVEHRFQAGRHQ